jgi:hypothetical protein
MKKSVLLLSRIQHVFVWLCKPLASHRGNPGLILGDLKWSVANEAALTQVFLRVIRLSLESSLHRCFILIYHRPMRCAIALAKQHIVTFDPKLGASSLTRHLAGLGVKVVSRTSLLSVLKMWLCLSSLPLRPRLIHSHATFKFHINNFFNLSENCVDCMCHLL